MSSFPKLGGALAAIVLLAAACTSGTASPAPSAATATPTPAAATATPTEAAASSGPGEETPTPAAETPTPAAETPTPAAETPTPAAETPTPAAETPVPSITPFPEPVAACPGGGEGGTLTGEITLWHSYGSGAGTEVDALNQALGVVCAENPGLVVNVVGVGFGDLFSAYKNQAPSGSGPDVFIAPNDSLWELAEAGLLMNVADKIDQTKFTQLALDGSKYTTSADAVEPGVDGIWQVPESLKAVAMYYNKDNVATPPATTDDLLAAVQGGAKVGLYQIMYHNYGWSGAYGGTLMDDAGKCIADQGGWSEAWAYLASLKAAGANFYTNYNDMADGFKNGTLDIIVDGPWAAGGYAESVTNLGVAPMPAGPNGDAALPLTGVDGWNINPFGSNTDLAVAFANRMAENDVQTIYADTAYHIPSGANVPASSNDVSAQFADAVVKGALRPQTPLLGAFWANFEAALNTVLDEGADPTAAVADACTTMNTTNGL